MDGKYISRLGRTGFEEKLVKILQASVVFPDTCSLTSEWGLGDHYVCRVTRQNKTTLHGGFINHFYSRLKGGIFSINQQSFLLNKLNNSP